MQPPIQPPTTEKKSGTASEPRTDVVLIADAQDPLVIGAGAEAVRSGAARATRAWKQADRAGHRRDLELDLLWTLALEIGAANDLQSALTVALESVCAATGWAMGEAWLPDDAAGVVHRDAVWIGDARRLQEFHAGSRQTVLARGEGLPGRVWASGTELWLPDVTTDETFARATLAKEAGLHAAVGIPVLADEQVVAVLVFFHFKTRNEERRLVDLTSAVAAQLGAVVQRKRIEDAYRRLEQRYETLLDHIPDSAWIKDEEGRYLAANHAFSEACGVPREKIVGRTDHDLFPTEVAERFWRDDRRVAEAGQRLTLEERVPWADGAEHWLETVKTPLRGDRGIVGTVGIARDVTERHRSEERERLLADAGRVLGSSLDREEVIQRVCGVVVPRLADWCVITLRESSGQSRVVQVAAADPDKNTAIRRMLEQGPAPRGSQGHPVDSVFGGEALLFSRLSRADLSAIAPDEEHTALLDALNPRSAMTVPLLAQGRVLGAMVLAASESGRHYDERDLALAEELGRRVALGIENARLYAAERTARAQAEAAMRARDEVLGIVAHDLRNPVGAISLCAAVLRDVVASEVGKEKHLDAILHAAGQMERLIQDLLEVSRIEAGRLSIDPEWVRPACLLVLQLHI